MAEPRDTGPYRGNMIDEHDPGVRHRNVVLAWWLLAIFLIIFAATFAVAYIYLAAD